MPRQTRRRKCHHWLRDKKKNRKEKKKKPLKLTNLLGLPVDKCSVIVHQLSGRDLLFSTNTKLHRAAHLEAAQCEHSYLLPIEKKFALRHFDAAYFILGLDQGRKTAAHTHLGCTYKWVLLYFEYISIYCVSLPLWQLQKHPIRWGSLGEVGGWFWQHVFGPKR